MKTTLRECLAAGLLLAAAHAGAQTYEVFHSFGAPIGQPFGPVFASASGTLYGTTTTGGIYGFGSVFMMTPDGSGGFTYSPLHSFVGADGAFAYDPLISGADGNLYGSALQGGATGVGTLYRLSPSGDFTRLHDFADGGGQQPAGLLLATDGAFYGTTRAGGAHGGGTIFRMGPDEAVSVVHDFDSAVEGAEPLSGLTQVGSFLYGTTSVGGASSLGTVYRVDMTTGELATLHEFDGTKGANPIASLILASDGNLYGTTSAGGSGGGTVFKVDGSGAVSLVYNFTDPSQGNSPRAPLFQGSDGKLYGTTAYGGCCYQGDTLPAGTVFRVDTQGSAFEQLATFWVPGPPPPPPLTDGPPVTPANTPLAGLVDGHDGFLYGTLAFPNGAVFRISPTDPQNLGYVHLYGSGDGPNTPVAPMTEANGGLYTTTSLSATGFGSILRFDGPHMKIVTDLAGSNGANPSIEVMLLASDGNLYGTTPNGGTGNGSVFRIEPDDTFVSMHAFFPSQGQSPTGGLLEAAGQFWGTASGGGDWYGGTIYRMDTSGVVLPAHAFGHDIFDGRTPYSGLTLGVDGKFYGTTNSGGSTDFGTIFSIDDQSTFTNLFSFDYATDCFYPIAGLVLASDGNFYGSCTRGGASQAGLVYRFDGSTVTSVHDFAGSDGNEPRGNLIQASDGKLYGTTYQGGSAGLGTIFRVDTSGNFELLHEFQGADGSQPQASLMQASDGTIYSTAGGGPGGGGVAYRLWFGDMTPALSGVEPTSGRAGGGTVLAVIGSHLSDVTSISIGGIAVTTPTFMDQSAVYTVSPALSPGTLNDVTVEVSGGGGLSLPGAWFADFDDVPGDDIFHDYVEKIVRAGITAGCGGGSYCRNDAVRRDQMAVFLLKAEHGSGYVPPACTGVFADVACPGPFTDWIERLAAEGVTAGCGGANYCPSQPVTRAQMAVFLLKTKEGSSYNPPPAVGIFGDVPQSNPFAPWIEELANREITGGCQSSPPLYCPANPNTRGQMAVFLVKTFGL